MNRTHRFLAAIHKVHVALVHGTQNPTLMRLAHAFGLGRPCLAGLLLAASLSACETKDDNESLPTFDNVAVECSTPAFSTATDFPGRGGNDGRTIHMYSGMEAHYLVRLATNAQYAIKAQYSNDEYEPDHDRISIAINGIHVGATETIDTQSWSHFIDTRSFLFTSGANPAGNEITLLVNHTDRFGVEFDFLNVDRSP